MSSDPQTVYNHAIKLHQQGQVDQAIQLLERLNQSAPTANSRFQLATFYFQQNQLQKAHDLYQTVLDQNPYHFLTHHQLARLLIALNDPHQALLSAYNCLNLKPDYSPAISTITQILSQINLTSLALFFNPSTQLHPDSLPPIPHPSTQLYNSYANTLVNAFTHLQQNCDYTKLPLATRTLNQLTHFQLKHDYPVSEPPFTHFTRSQDQATNLKIAQRLSDSINLNQSLHPAPASSSQLNIGYISDGFRNFATSHNLVQIIELHSNRIQTFGFSHSLPTKDSYQNRIYQAFTRVHQLTSPDPNQISQDIARSNTHIAVDLKGHSLNSKLEALSCRPAPIQASFLGYPATTGADFIDFLLTDPIVTPPTFQPHYSEKFIFLPHSYRPLDSSLITSTTHSPTPNSIQLTCFSRSYKIENDVFHTWLNLLKHHPQTTLHLYSQNQLTQHHLTQTASALINPDRIIFHPTFPKPQHLERLNHFHLSLDTHTVNGHTTTIDSLLAGVPLVTHIGSHFASRVSASALLAANLSELITHSRSDYQTTLSQLISHPHKLNRLTRKLCYAQKHYPLFDSTRFTHNLEVAYFKMWHHHQQHKLPHSFTVTDPQPMDSSYIPD